MSADFDIVVAGGGITGLSAGLAAARLGHSTLVLTGNVLGGHLLTIDKVDGYPGFPEGIPGYDLCPMAQEQAEEAGAQIEMANLTALESAGETWRVSSADNTYTARSVIIATGTRFRELGVDGESMLRGKGVSQCASCDAPLLRNRPVVVAGGGDSALQEALTLAEHCSSITIVHHGQSYAAQAAYRSLAEQNPKIVSMPASEVAAILGDQAVEGVRVRGTAGTETTELDCAAAFVFIGLRPNTAFMDDSQLDDERAIVTDAAMRTSLPGLLAAGTVRSGSAGRAAAAAGEGAAAAVTADGFLRDGHWPSS